MKKENMRISKMIDFLQFFFNEIHFLNVFFLNQNTNFLQY